MDIIRKRRRFWEIYVDRLALYEKDLVDLKDKLEKITLLKQKANEKEDYEGNVPMGVTNK